MVMKNHRHPFLTESKLENIRKTNTDKFEHITDWVLVSCYFWKQHQDEVAVRFYIFHHHIYCFLTR